MVIIGSDDNGYLYLWRPGNYTVNVMDNLMVEIDMWSFGEPPETIEDACERAAEHIRDLQEEEGELFEDLRIK